ncbi:MAG: PIN domain-containing protein [Candidatus Hermodarchaeota archaeon]
MKSNTNLIVIDSNFILLPFQFKIDYLNEIRDNLEGNLKFIIYQQILNELEAKRKREIGSTKFQRLLNSGLMYLEKNKGNFEIDYIDEVKQEDESTDEFLFRKSKELKDKSQTIFLATNDSQLRRKAKQANINIIFLRQKKFLYIERA